MNLCDTIIAISSPPFDSALGLVRLSGARAITIAEQIFRDDENSADASTENFSQNYRGARRGKIFYQSDFGECALPTLLYQMPTPHSYTGENVAEFIAPGSLAVLQKIVNLGRELGARLAEPGEFTWRAVMLGRLSLTAANAVAELVGGDCKNRRAAISELRAGVKTELAFARSTIENCAVAVETELDFADDFSAENAAEFFVSLNAQIISAQNAVEKTLARSKKWRRRENFPALGLIGATNAGKSSLFNALLSADAAIVSAQKSTTRDQLLATLTIDHFKFSLIDCAGEDFSSVGGALNFTENSPNNFAFALAIAVIDRNNPAWNETVAALRKIPNETPVLLVFNKADLSAAENVEQITTEKFANELDAAISPPQISGTVSVSAISGYGLAELREKIVEIVARDIFVADDYHEREAASLAELQATLARAKFQADAQNLELAAIEIRAASELLMTLTGEHYDEQILRAIFSRLCVGK